MIVLMIFRKDLLRTQESTLELWMNFFSCLENERMTLRLKSLSTFWKSTMNKSAIFSRMTPNPNKSNSIFLEKTNNRFEIKQGKDGMYVPNLTTMQVNCPEDVKQLMSLGSKNRASAATNSNEHSSRSHS